MKAITVPLLWKWSVRDLRQRWMQVLGVSIIIALGVAVFSGLGSASPWRTKSLDESYAMLNMHDVKLVFTPGSYLDAGRLSQVIDSIPQADWIEDVELRLSVSTSVNASTPDQSVLVSGQLIGVDVTPNIGASAQPNGGPVIDRLHVTSGRALEAGDAGEPVCIVEYNFATHYDLKPEGRSIQVSGGYTLEPVGNAISPEHFMVIEEESGALGIMAQDRLAVLFVPLETAQEIAGLPGMVNEALITVPAGIGEEELDQLKAALQDAMAQAFPQVGLNLEKRSENRVYRILYDDIPGDQGMFDTFAFILLLGAAFGAFILIGRIVDAQRREIGINMALGVPRVRIACRYLLVSGQIALLGMALGMVLGLFINQPLGELISQMIPTPYFESPLQPEVFLRGALIGLVVPFLAVLYPIWRAIRVPPVDAIQTGYLVSKGGGLAPLLARSPLGRVSGSSFTQLPLRNLSRGLQRTLMTVLGLSMAIVVLIAIIGMIDSIDETLDSGRQEARKSAPDRMLVLFDDFYPLAGDLVSGIASDSRVAQVVPDIALPGRVTGDETIDVLIQLLDLDNDLWTPTIVRGENALEGQGPGILITEKAARDLGVDVGDSVTLRHLYRESQYAWRFAKTAVQVVGIHPDILRTTVYMDIQDATIMNLDGVANGLHINPATGVEEDALRQELSQFKQVASVRRTLATSEAVRDILDEFLGVLAVVQVAVLLMAFLIAFNTTRSNIDERRRELATMFAFGTRVRTALRMSMVENLIIGILGTAAGIGLGWLVLNTMLQARMETMMPELNPVISVSPATLGMAVLIGVVAVAVTPVFMVRRLVQMDLPSTLRVVE